MKIGIIGSDQTAHLMASLFKTVDGLEITGCYDDDYTIAKDFAANYQIIPYPTYEALFRYADAVIINFKANEGLLMVENCLKHFKHVFLINAQYLRYESYLKLEKIAEESNVKFYPVFGINVGLLLSNVAKGKDLLFININHSYPVCHGIYANGCLPALLLQDANLMITMTDANVKKISAGGWGIGLPGTGILNAKLDFDDGSTSSLLMFNSGKREELKVDFYYKSKIIQIICIGHIVKVTTKDYDDNQQKNLEFKFTDNELLLEEFKLFQASVQNSLSATQIPDSKCKSIRAAHLIHEKIHHLISSLIFY